MTTQPAWHGPLVSPDGRLLKPLIDFLRSLGSGVDTVTTSTETITETVTVLQETAAVALLAGEGMTVETVGVNTYRLTATAGDMMPVLLEDGETYTVPENKQALFAMTPDIEGDLIVDGYMVEV